MVVNIQITCPKEIIAIMTAYTYFTAIITVLKL